MVIEEENNIKINWRSEKLKLPSETLILITVYVKGFKWRIRREDKTENTKEKQLTNGYWE